MSDFDEELDPVTLSIQLERVSNILESTCQCLEDKDKLDLLPDNAYDWWESLKSAREREIRKRAAAREDLVKSAMDKLSPEELDAIRND
jgi:hypothetical protein